MVNKKAITKIITPPQIKRFTIETVSKYATKGVKNLVEMLSLFPNQGIGFKIFNQVNKTDYYIVDNVNFKDNRHAKIFGIFHKNGIMGKKVEQIKNTLKTNRWKFEPTTEKCYTDNGIEYDIARTEALIEEKKKLLAKRNQLLGFIDHRRNLAQEIRKKKAESKGKKK
jgi:hypothetical protein